ncbi:pre-toxin TG domain-containing protein [Geobacillus icigianus]|nr:pre-toxin TG domain-containing protein [Geobacillus subterraneus]
MIRLRPDELETVAKHIPDAEDACQRARMTLSRELSSLAMDLPGVSTPAIEALRDELIHWLRCYEQKLNEAEELLYRTAAAMRQADQTIADNMKEFGLELLGWYDVQRVFGEYDPITGERLSVGDRLLAGGMLLASMVPPAKGAGMAVKAAIKGAKAMEAASVLSKTKHVVRYDKIKAIFETTYQQVVKAPFAGTVRLFKKQWDELVKSVATVSRQPVYAGAGSIFGKTIQEATKGHSNVMDFSVNRVTEKVIDDTAENIAKKQYAYNMVENPGPLAEVNPWAASTFRSGMYNVIKLEEDIILYRSGKAGGGKNALGQYFTRKPSTKIEGRIDLAVKAQWIDQKTGVITGSSPLESVYAIKIPKGTTLYEGPVGYQGGIYQGGGIQIFVPEPWKIKGVEIISEMPIK